MRAVLAVCVCAMLSGAVFAQEKENEKDSGPEKGSYAPDIEAKEWINTDEPISLSEMRGMSVVLFFWVSWHEGGESILPLMNLVNSAIGRSRGVYMIGLTDATKARIADTLKKEKVFFPVGVESKSAEEYKVPTFPYVVIIDPRGRIAWKGWPGTGGGDTLVKEIMEALADTPATKTHPAEAALAEKALKEARQSLRAEDYQEAFTSAREAEEHALMGDPLRMRCQDMLELIEALGRDQLAQAEQAAAEKRFEDAVGLLRGVGRDFKGMEVAKSARRKLDALKKKYPEVAKVLERSNESVLAENELARALKEMRKKDIGKACVRLESVISDYPATEAAGKAKTVLERVQKNPALMDHVRDYKASRECESLLSAARAYVQAGQPNKAKDAYRKIISDHGDTIYAEEAARRLTELP